MTLGNLGDLTMLEQTYCTLIHAELHVTQGSERGVCGYGDAESLCEVYERFLGKVGVKLDLKSLGFYASVAEDVQDYGSLAVTARR